MSSSAEKSDAESVKNENPSTQSGDLEANSKDRQDLETVDEVLDQSSKKEEEKEGDEEDEEEGECGFCLFMKGGGCKDSFVAWENCIEEAEKNKEDIVTKCMEVTADLKKCMDAHSDYYEPILKAEKAAEEEAKKELEKEKAADESKKNEASDESEKKSES